MSARGIRGIGDRTTSTARLSSALLLLAAVSIAPLAGCSDREQPEQTSSTRTVQAALETTGSGEISFEEWDGVFRNPAAIPVDTDPDRTGTYASFASPTSIAHRFGRRVHGILTAPTTGDYTFWIAADDEGELWLSTSASPDDKSLIASLTKRASPLEWNRYAEQKSQPVSLVAGGKYYIEALQPESLGADHVEVGWAKPGEATSEPSEVIPGTQLSPWVPCTSAADCDDGNDCTDDLCNAGTCENPNKAGTCDDDDACTEGGVCADGVCVGTAKDCSGEDSECTTGVCNAETGECEAEPANEGGDCDDGDLCTTGDTCSSGSCDGTAKDCSGMDGQCTSGVCNPADGSCEAEPANEGGGCDDGDLCTEGETCSGGACGSGTPVTCDDGQFCNGVESCDSALGCQAGTAPSLGDGVDCTDDSCDEASDQIVHVANDANCDNANVCDGAETCDALLDCQSGTPLSCDDGQFCNGVESCDSVSG